MVAANECDTSMGTDDSWAYVRRKTFKNTFEFNLMILGAPGIGKTSLVKELYEFESVDCPATFRAESHFLYHTRKHASAEATYPAVSVRSSTHEMDKGRLRIKLNIVEAPMLGEALDSRDCWAPISEYVDAKFEEYLKQESGIYRRNLVDNRVHCVLYLLDANKKKLGQLDIEVMKSISSKCNILPVLAKVDMVDPAELDDIRRKINKQLEQEQIQLYAFPEFDPDESEEFNKANKFIRNNYPLSVISGGKPSAREGDFSRVYPWGTLTTNDPKMSNINVLKTILRKTHVSDLKLITEQIHYENYRSWRLGAPEANGCAVSVDRYACHYVLTTSSCLEI